MCPEIKRWPSLTGAVCVARRGQKEERAGESDSRSNPPRSREWFSRGAKGGDSPVGRTQVRDPPKWERPIREEHENRKKTTDWAVGSLGHLGYLTKRKG